MGDQTLSFRHKNLELAVETASPPYPAPARRYAAEVLDRTFGCDLPMETWRWLILVWLNNHDVSSMRRCPWDPPDSIDSTSVSSLAAEVLGQKPPDPILDYTAPPLVPGEKLAAPRHLAPPQQAYFGTAESNGRAHSRPPEVARWEEEQRRKAAIPDVEAKPESKPRPELGTREPAVDPYAKSPEYAAKQTDPARVSPSKRDGIDDTAAPGAVAYAPPGDAVDATGFMEPLLSQENLMSDLHGEGQRPANIDPADESAPMTSAPVGQREPAQNPLSQTQPSPDAPARPEESQVHPQTQSYGSGTRQRPEVAAPQQMQRTGTDPANLDETQQLAPETANGTQFLNASDLFDEGDES